MDPSYPIRKFQDLLDRLNHNDGRYFRCLADLTRDFPMFAPMFVDVLERSLQRITRPPKNLYFLYVLDCISKTLPRVYAPLFANRLYRMFMHAYEYSDGESAYELQRLVEAWQSIQPPLFQPGLLESIKEGINSANNVHSASPDSPRIQDFDLGPGEWMAGAMDLPEELAMQAGDDTSPLLFAQLLSLERNRCEFEVINAKAAVMTSFGFDEAYVDELYQELPKQCLKCGSRFALESELAEHLDWHFRNRNERQTISPWLPTCEAWTDPRRARLGTMLEGTNPETKAAAEQLAVCNPEQLACILCGELFELTPTEQDWRCKDTVVVFLKDRRQNVLLHTSCYQSLSVMEVDRPESVSVCFQDSFA